MTTVATPHLPLPPVPPRLLTWLGQRSWESLCKHFLIHMHDNKAQQDRRSPFRKRKMERLSRVRITNPSWPHPGALPTPCFQFHTTTVSTGTSHNVITNVHIGDKDNSNKGLTPGDLPEAEALTPSWVLRAKCYPFRSAAGGCEGLRVQDTVAKGVTCVCVPGQNSLDQTLHMGPL